LDCLIIFACVSPNTERTRNRPLRSGGPSSFLGPDAEVSALFLSLPPGKFRQSTPSPCFTSVRFTPFCFNSPCQFTPLLNLRALIPDLTPFGCSIFIYLSLFNGISFLVYAFLSYAHFFRDATNASSNTLLSIKSNNGRLSPHHFQLVIHQPLHVGYHPMLRNLCYLTAPLNRARINK
jgi:hypothetical protein